MKIHHLNCGTFCPIGGRLFDGSSTGLRAHMVCHCLLIESEAGLILVDTGLGSRDVTDSARLSPPFRWLLNLPLRPEETALAQLKGRGFKPEDVRHIVVTHLDFDHAGGIADFPNATVHATAREKEVADAQGSVVDTQRYRPQQWEQAGGWKLYPMGGGEPWFGFDAVRDLAGLPPEILLVPLVGHSWGHSGVAIKEDDGGWLLHAGDAYFYRGEVGSEDYTCPMGLRGLQLMTQVDHRARLGNQQRLRSLSLDHGDEVRVFCAHDPVEFEILRGLEPVAS